MKEQLSPIELHKRHIKTATTIFFIALILAVSIITYIISST
ncbi:MULTISPECIES: hypothetical protein [Clostridium]|uniref:Uncharacterized protein n=2 Tax=Clostridium TaxID=1485 RepID=A0A166SV88_9CLOT|nr:MULTISPECIES: hypothetical protein [Clostridium]OAA84488.1 hypothetical protein WX45_00956 [Clostridium ljungdahlii DSM 13528]ALU37055.1 Hypothetical protein CLAU_2627 [Clostridium autoethanogenum DSM 10061]OAA92811.1 hypothetical protein WX73_00695 [Clostridium coskatii]OBR92144.1 hypothetical protein CLCOS_31390 [Clostridium coskatii]OVY48751.1 hypothetical protein WX72_00391 [Clostridium autoethanogenum]